jgi:hypothetical protein
MKFIFIINRYKYRKLAFNNFLKIKTLNNYRIIDLSGPFFSWLGYLIYKLNLSDKFKFISCDGWPFLSNEKNSINIWFGGTYLKIPETLQKYKNNYVTARTVFTNYSNVIQFYPCKIKKMINKKNTKIIIALSCKDVEDPFVLKIWNENKNKILNNFLLLETEKFWSNIGLNDLDNKKRHAIYIDIKSLVRIELLRIIKNAFNDLCIFIGNDLKKHFPDALSTKFEESYLKNLYDGNICIDFLAKDGDQLLYPRSIEIIESGGVLFQIETENSDKLFEKFKNKLTFNTSSEMTTKLENLIKNDKQLKTFNEFFINKFNFENYNEKSFKNILI